MTYLYNHSKFAKRLKKLRCKFQLNQQELAEKLGVSKATISGYELCKRNPSVETLAKLTQIFHVTSDYLLGWEEKKVSLNVEGLNNEEIEAIESMIRLFQKVHSKEK